MITYHRDLLQGSDEWLEVRRGLLTASEMKMILTPTLKVASNDKERAHLYELLAQRITGYVEPHYIGDDMLRGHEDEIEARLLYAKHYAPVEEVGFITNDVLGFNIGCSPDGLVGDDGMIECKSRRQKFQVEVIITGEVPTEHMMQVQTALFVTGRKWCDYVSYCGGMPMMVIRVLPDYLHQVAIATAATAFEYRIIDRLSDFNARLDDGVSRFIPTERRIEQEMHI